MAADRQDDGSGLLPLIWGVFAFLLFLFLAAQVAITLYSTSTVTALGHDAARRAALGGATPEAVADAEAWFTDRLGDSVTLVSADWSVGDGTIALSIVVEPPDLLVTRLSPLGADPIERTFVVRIEQLVAAP